MAKFNRDICSLCRKVFVKQFDEDLCHACIVNEAEIDLHRKAGKIRLIKCKKCGNDFEVCFMYASQKSREYCSKECRPPPMMKAKKETPTEAKIRKANEKWMSDEKKKSGRPLPIQVLINASEKKRVWDDKGWDHYLKGRKWDRI